MSNGMLGNKPITTARIDTEERTVRGATLKEFAQWISYRRQRLQRIDNKKGRAIETLAALGDSHGRLRREETQLIVERLKGASHREVAQWLGISTRLLFNLILTLDQAQLTQCAGETHDGEPVRPHTAEGIER